MNDADRHAMNIKKVAIVGFGGMGAMYAAHLSSQAANVDCEVVADADRVTHYRKEGLVFNGKSMPINFRSYEEVKSPYDLVIFAVKYHCLPGAILQSRRLVGSETTIISVLNGIVSEDVLAEAFGSKFVLPCVAQEMDTSKTGSIVTCGSIGVLALGVFDERELSRLKKVTDFFASVDLPYIVPDDINHQLWGKLMVNTGVNQACAVYDCDFEGIHSPGVPRSAMIEAMREVAAVASKRGIDLGEDDLRYWIDIIDALNPSGRPSLRQDILAQRKTEVDLFSGTICALGDEHDIDTPVNDMFYKRIKEIEATW